jgi:integrase/recombinase XerD
LKAVRQKIKPAVSSTFFPQAQEYLNSLQNSGKFNRYSADKPRIGHFKEFLNNRDLAFSDLTPGLLQKFVVYLKTYHIGKKNKKAMSERTIVNHLAVIRSVFAYARRNKVVTKEQSPFGGDDGIKIVFPDTKKLGLSPEDVERMEQVVLTDPRHDHVRNLWLVSFYFAGMRVSDVFRLRWSDFHDGRLHYIMGKNDKGGSLKIPEKASAILEKYKPFKENKNDLVFPELKNVDFSDEFKVQKTIAVKNRAINLILRDNVASIANLEAIPKMHKARHTFGGLAGDAIPIQMLQKLYRHTHVSTTIGYQGSFIHKDADDALDAVINKASTPKSKP